MIIKNGIWTVYIHVNKTTNKPYVGLTSEKNPENRWGSNGINYRGCPKLWNAICKYSWADFEHYIFARNLTKEEASNAEKLLIKKLNSIDDGYNIEPGGIDQGPRSEEAIRKLREARMKQIITPEQYEKGAAKRRGRKHSDEWCKNQREGIRKSKGTPVMCIETGKTYNSFAAAQEDTGVMSCNILTSIRRHEAGVVPRNRGLHWMYAPQKPNDHPLRE